MIRSPLLVLTVALCSTALVAQGNRPTLRGTPASETLVGTAIADNIIGMGGNDVILGLEGDDTLTGGPDNDLLDGGDGDDKLTASSGDDELQGGAGDDRLDGGDGRDLLVGGLGDDEMYAGDDEDVVVAVAEVVPGVECPAAPLPEFNLMHLGKMDDIVQWAESTCVDANNAIASVRSGNGVVNGDVGYDVVEVRAGDFWGLSTDYEIVPATRRGYTSAVRSLRTGAVLNLKYVEAVAFRDVTIIL